MPGAAEERGVQLLQLLVAVVTIAVGKGLQPLDVIVALAGQPAAFVEDVRLVGVGVGHVALGARQLGLPCS